MADNFQRDIHRLCIAYFGRPADLNSLVHLQALMAQADDSLAVLAVAIARSRAFRLGYAELNPSAAVAKVYRNMFACNPALDDLQHWATLLDDGAVPLYRIVAQMLSAAGPAQQRSFESKLDQASGDVPSVG